MVNFPASLCGRPFASKTVDTIGVEKHLWVTQRYHKQARLRPASSNTPQPILGLGKPTWLCKVTPQRFRESSSAVYQCT